MIRPLIFSLEDYYSLAYMCAFVLYRLAEAPGNGEGLPSFSFQILLHGRKPKQPTSSCIFQRWRWNGRSGFGILHFIFHSLGKVGLLSHLFFSLGLVSNHLWSASTGGVLAAAGRGGQGPLGYWIPTPPFASSFRTLLEHFLLRTGSRNRPEPTSYDLQSRPGDKPGS